LLRLLLLLLLQVGGPTLDAALAAARPHARIVACGAISQYSLPAEKRYGVKNLMNVSGCGLRVELPQQQAVACVRCMLSGHGHHSLIAA
jgi:NADPH:quinone reductase-like Zn-dependent oxidoreductase